ncbi:hypothetical protein GTA08_BOTSDO14201 [Botryosphaeria dothidea]|uniref:Type I-C CRISPR-associated protein Cas5 n=1 Tax=Botryosphaeria dothidea TaxID=55169 RepID=A0A8H4IRG6_9PEZI|nr:hypothetical protein GTA08_BOTSDO14201 [Botryosphaeria dothidea]
MKVERVSYDVITPSAARGILEAIHWKPAISIRRNEVGGKLSPASVVKAMKAGSTASLATCVDEDRQQRAATVLRDVRYLIEAHFELTGRAGPDDSVANTSISSTAAPERGTPPPEHGVEPDKDLGWMLHDIDFSDGMTPRFFRAHMRNGVIERMVEREAKGIAGYGYSPEKISYEIVLAPDGTVLAVNDIRDTTGKKAQPRVLDVPQPEKRTVGIKSNFLWDKTSYVLGVSATSKRTDKEHEAFKAFHEKRWPARR